MTEKQLNALVAYIDAAIDYSQAGYSSDGGLVEASHKINKLQDLRKSFEIVSD